MICIEDLDKVSSRSGTSLWKPKQVLSSMISSGGELSENKLITQNGRKRFIFGVLLVKTFLWANIGMHLQSFQRLSFISHYYGIQLSKAWFKLLLTVRVTDLTGTKNAVVPFRVIFEISAGIFFFSQFLMAVSSHLFHNSEVIYFSFILR